MTQTQTTASTSLLNGIDTDAMGATVRAIGEQPIIAQFQFRAQNEWLAGGHNQTTVRDFDGACQRHVHKTPHVLGCDEPPVLLGKDAAASPAAFALHALAGCLCSTLVIHATARGVRIRSVKSTLAGDVDLRGFLGLDETVRNGFSGIRVGLEVEADAPTEVIDELVETVKARSPLFDIITNPTPLEVYRVR